MSTQLPALLAANDFNSLQESMASVANMAMLTVDWAGNPISVHSRCSPYCRAVRAVPHLAERCKRCDSRGGIEAARLRQPYIYRCHMGLVDLAIPIFVEGSYAGAILAGQVQVDARDGNGDLELIAGRTDDGPEDPALHSLRLALPSMSLDRIRTVARLVFEIFRHLGESPFSAARRGTGGHPILEPALDHMRRHCTADLDMAAMARICGISPRYFSKLFNLHVGESFSAYMNGLRVEAAKKLLADRAIPITTVALETGFGDSSYFNKVFRSRCGMSPLAYRRALGTSS